MKFDATIPIVNGSSDPDPLTSPGLVPDDKVVAINSQAPPTDRGVTKGLLLALAGTGSEQVTLDIFALDEATQDLPKANRTYYRFATGVIVIHGRITEVTVGMPPGGRLYFRQTAETVIADRVMKIAAVDR